MSCAIKEAIFIVESLAHLQGHERLLLPTVDAARAEHEALLAALQDLLHHFNPPEGAPEWASARAAIAAGAKK